MPIFTKISNLGEAELVYNGELEAITQAIEYASSTAKEVDNFIVFLNN